MSRIQQKILAELEVMNVHLRHIHNDAHVTARGGIQPPSFTSALEPIVEPHTPQMGEQVIDRLMQCNRKLERIGWLLYSTVRAYWREGRGAGTGYASDEATMHVLKEWEDAHKHTIPRHPGEDPSYEELEDRLQMFATIGLQLYEALQTNERARMAPSDRAADTARHERHAALRAWENRFKERAVV